MGHRDESGRNESILKPRKVFDELEGALYPSAIEASKAANMSIYSMYQMLTANGNNGRWRYEDAEASRPGKPVISSDGRVWASAVAASKAMGLHPKRVASAILRGQRAGGLEWRYLEDEEQNLP